MSGLPAFPSQSGTLPTGSPFFGHSGFGFAVPQGDPGAIAGAAKNAFALSTALTDQEGRLDAAGGIAGDSASWGGSAATAFANYCDRLIRACTADAAACLSAAGALAAFSTDLATAQRKTGDALADCQRSQTELTTQQTRADTAHATAQRASQQAATAPDPVHAGHLSQQASAARSEHAAAAKAAAAAQRELEHAKRRGRVAATAYEHDVATVTRRLQAAAGELHPPPRLADGVPVPISVSAADTKLAQAMQDKAGDLDDALNALMDPAALKRLAGRFPLSPGAALAYVRDVLRREYKREHSDNLDGSVGGAIPGPLGQFLDGAWHVTAESGKLLWEGVTNPEEVPGAVVDFVAWAATHPDDFLAGAIDWEDWKKGNYARALGSIGAGFFEAKGAGKLGGAAKKGWQKHPELRPEMTKGAAGIADFMGAVGAKDAADALAPLSELSSTAWRAAIKDQAIKLANLAGAPKIEPVIFSELMKTYSPFTYQPIVVTVPKVIKPPPQTTMPRPRGR